MEEKQEYQYQPIVPGNEYYNLERRSEIREGARKLRRQYLRYKEAEIIYSMSHKKLLELAGKAGAIVRIDATVLIDREVFDRYPVNASVPKTLVRFVCSAYAAMCSSEELRKTLESICDTPVTPELTPNHDGEITQMTEEKIGKYDLNDFFLFYTLRYGFEPSRTVAYALRAYPELTSEEVRKAAGNFFKRFFSQQFKRSCMPDGPKVGSVSLSPRGDWRMPSDATASLWMEDLLK